MKSLSAWLHRCSSPVTIALAIIVYGMFLAFVMIPEGALVATFAGEWGSPDGHWFYSPNELYRELSTWGDAGRAHYVDFRLGLDPVWALAYTAFLITITSVALRNAFPANDRRQLLNLVALVPMLADLTENALGIVLVTNFPARLDAIAWLTTAVSASKWLTLTLAHLIMLYAIAAAVLRRFRNT